MEKEVKLRNFKCDVCGSEEDVKDRIVEKDDKVSLERQLPLGWKEVKEGYDELRQYCSENCYKEDAKLKIAKFTQELEEINPF